jgi:prepilin-type N-terminal cleavage/methylation domain-containing protein
VKTDCLGCKRLPKKPRAFTLLEVILAIAILGVSLAIIGEGFRAGLRNIDEARHEVRASLVAESILSQVACGEILPENVSDVAYTFDPNWLYSITSEPPPENPLDGLLSVSVTVRHVSQPRYSVTMGRWLTDPAWLAEQEANNPLNQAAANASTDAASSSSTGSGSSSSSSGGAP